MSARTDEELLTVEEVSRLLKVPVSWVYEQCREGARDRLPHVKLGKYLRFSKSDLRDYMEARKRGEFLRS